MRLPALELKTLDAFALCVAVRLLPVCSFLRLAQRFWRHLAIAITPGPAIGAADESQRDAPQDDNSDDDKSNFHVTRPLIHCFALANPHPSTPWEQRVLR